MENMNDQLSGIEIDTIGEILNISMGSAATAISTLLDRQVNITTPKVSVIPIEEFDCKCLEPALGIEIEYIEGLSGSNFLVMKRTDIRAIVDLLIGEESGGDNDEELDEMHISAISEIMNQMMGASATALASFFGKSINISTPKQFDPQDVQSRMSRPGQENSIVTVKFVFKVEGLIDSEFVSIFPVEFTKELVANALSFGEPEPQKASPVPTKPKASAEPEQRQSEKVPSTQKPAVASAPPKSPAVQVSVQPLKLKNFDDDLPLFGDEENQTNLSMLMGVPLEITVEIGRTKKQVREILEIRQGSLLELDKQSGDPVDIIVNGQLMARGDVVVIDDNFGVRITEIIHNKDIISKLK